MTTRFESYSRTPRGGSASGNHKGTRAIAALVSLLRPEIETLRLADRRAFDAAKQFVGWAVGSMMRDHGHTNIGQSRVPGGLFTVGAIWSGEPMVS